MTDETTITPTAFNVTFLVGLYESMTDSIHLAGLPHSKVVFPRLDELHGPNFYFYY